MSQGEVEIDESVLFFEANGGKNKRDRSYGFGSEVAFYGSLESRSGTKTKATQLSSSKVKLVCDRLGVVEERNQYLESELIKIRNIVERNQHLESEFVKVRSLLEKLTGSSASPGHDTSTSKVSPSIPDDDVNDNLGNDENLGGD